jgi:hypothetical protein
MTADHVQRVRLLHRLNAGFSGVTGAVLVIGSGTLGAPLDLPSPLLVALGAGLLGWSAALVALANRPAPQLIAMSRLVAGADAAWVVVSLVVATLRAPSPLGLAGIVGTSMVVAAFAVAGLAITQSVRAEAMAPR